MKRMNSVSAEEFRVTFDSKEEVVYKKHDNPQFWVNYVFTSPNIHSLLKYVYDEGMMKPVVVHEIVNSKKVKCTKKTLERLIRQLKMDGLIRSHNGVIVPLKNRQLIMLIQKMLLRAAYAKESIRTEGSWKQKKMDYFLPKMLNEPKPVSLILKEAREIIDLKLSKVTLVKELEKLYAEGRTGKKEYLPGKGKKHKKVFYGAF